MAGSYQHMVGENDQYRRGGASLLENMKDCGEALRALLYVCRRALHHREIVSMLDHDYYPMVRREREPDASFLRVQDVFDCSNGIVMQAVVDPLTDDEVAQIDPGIRDLVQLLRRWGFETTDSGDGVSKPKDWFDSGEALPFAHVWITDDAVAIAGRGRSGTGDRRGDLGGRGFIQTGRGGWDHGSRARPSRAASGGKGLRTMEVIRLVRVDFDNLENRDSRVETEIGIFGPADGKSAYGHVQDWFNSQPPVRLYTGYDHAVYPQWKLIASQLRQG